MTKEEFRSLRVSLGYTQDGLAREWGYSSNGMRTIRRWESGDTALNPVAAYCLRLMAKTNKGTETHENPDQNRGSETG